MGSLTSFCIGANTAPALKTSARITDRRGRMSLNGVASNRIISKAPAYLAIKNSAIAHSAMNGQRRGGRERAFIPPRTSVPTEKKQRKQKRYVAACVRVETG